jgi:hypothetical protein
MHSIFVDAPTGTGSPRCIQFDRQGDLTPYTPLLLDRVLVRCTGVVDLPPDLESCHIQAAGHGEA